LFSGWPDDVFPQLIRMSSIERYEHGESIHRIGDKVRGLYVVLTGSLENSLLQQKGRRYVLDYVPPGGVIGLIPTLDRRTALTDVRAHDDTTVVLIPRERFRALLQERPALLFTLVADLCQNVRRFGAHIERLAMLPLRERVAHALLSLASSYGHFNGTGIDIGLKVSQDDLAGMLSVSRQRVNGELRAMVREGIISARYSHITILNPGGLAARVADEALRRSLAQPMLQRRMKNVSPTG
jgi:CRP-like cAMP-binding protein